MIEFVAGVLAAVAARLGWRLVRPRRHSAALDRRLDQVRALPMTPDEVRAASDRIRLHQEKWPA